MKKCNNFKLTRVFFKLKVIFKSDISFFFKFAIDQVKKKLDFSQAFYILLDKLR